MKTDMPEIFISTDVETDGPIPGPNPMLSFDSTKRNMPRAWFGPGRHTHVALDDAIEQGELFCNMLRAAESLRGAK